MGICPSQDVARFKPHEGSHIMHRRRLRIRCFLRHAVVGAALFLPGAFVGIEAEASDVSVPSFAIVDAGSEAIVPLEAPAGLDPRPAFEQPPVVVEGLKSRIFVTTGFSWFCSADGGLFADASPSLHDCRLFSGPARIDLATGRGRSPADAAHSAEDWKRSYEGVVASILYDHSRAGSLLISVAHGENKNEVIGGRYYQGTVDADVKAEACASGEASGGYVDCWASYNGFVNLIVASPGADQRRQTWRAEERGPLVWPSMGYLKADGGKASDGVRHPSAIRRGDDLYVFYVDTSRGADLGRRGGLEVARAHLGDGTAAIVAHPFFEDAFSEGASLPQGFDKSRIRSFYGSRGGPASELWRGSRSVLRFSVAALRGAPFFVGVEEDLDGQAWRVQLRLSRDLVHWGEPVLVPGESRSDGWRNGTMHYPLLCDLAGVSENEVDPGGFYLLGTQAGGKVARRLLRLKVLE